LVFCQAQNDYYENQRGEFGLINNLNPEQLKLIPGSGV
jgi:hypothetical protein